MHSARTEQDLANDAEAIKQKLMPQFRKENPAGKTQVRWDTLATLCGICIISLQARKDQGDQEDSPELQEAAARIEAAKLRKAELEEQKLQREIAELEADANPGAPPTSTPSTEGPNAADLGFVKRKPTKKDQERRALNREPMDAPVADESTADS